MNKLHNKKQQLFFDIDKHQYSLALIKNPPLHTRLEINTIMEKLPNLNRNSVIIDFGSGSGRVTIPLLQKGFSVLSIDVSSKSLSSLKKVAKDLALKKLKTANTLPNNVRFKAIVGADILHHIELDAYLPRLYHLLQEKGRAIFSESAGLNVSWYIYLPFFYSWDVEKGIMACTYFNLKRKFKKYGFKNVQISGLGLLPRPLFKWSEKLCKLNDSLGNLPLFKFFAYRYIIEATK